MKQELLRRRENLFNKIDDNSVVVLFGGVGKKRSADEDYNFIVNRNFYYLTGIEQENSALIMYKSGSEKYCYLLIDEKDPKKEAWTGIRLSFEDAKELSAIEDVSLISSLEEKLANLFTKTKVLYLDLEKEQKVAADTCINKFKKGLLKHYEDLDIRDVYETIIKLRQVKSPYEVERLKDAIELTNRCIQNLMHMVKPNMYEYNLKNKFQYDVSENLSYLSFPTIVAGGKNATILHYPNASDMLHNGDLVLCDLGATNGNYCADISRTFPINGKFTDLERQIYQLVLDTNKEIIKTAKPGLRIVDLQEKTKELLAEGAIKLGIIKTKEELINIYFHGVSHHLGLDTHDPDYSNRTSILEPGNVITVEPGLYIKELGIGIRIEDDVLITEDGSECLSKNIIKEIKDIEDFMSK